MKITVAAVQMAPQLSQVAANLELADTALREAHRAGATLAVLPEMFNTGYGLRPEFDSDAEGADGLTQRHLSRRGREWRMGIVAGFVERDGTHLYDSLAIHLPNGSTHVYRKRHLVFWEQFRFRPGRSARIVPTPWGRVGLAICADMIHGNVWDDYRGRIDIGVIASAWPEFTCRNTGRKHWLLGRLGPLAGEIPVKAARDLGIPVICANQCGPTRTTIPILGLGITQRIEDRFAGRSTICDGRHNPPVTAGLEPRLLLAEVSVAEPRGLSSCHTTYPLDPAASCSGSG